MQNNIIPFDFGDNLVRVHKTDDSSFWFVAKDVCQVLDLSNTSKAIDSLDEDEKGVTNSYTLGGQQSMSIISESGLYSLIFRSRKPEAKKFRKWVTSEVLPSLRKTGTYECVPAPAPTSCLPDATLYLKPNLRSTAMNTAMQMVKHTDGTLEDLDSLYAKYCAMLAAKPTISQEPKGLPPLRRLVSTAGTELDEHLFQQWAVERLSPVLRKGVQAAKLYNDFTHFCKKHGVQPPVIKIWGTLMGDRFEKYKSGNICYKVAIVPVPPSR